MKPVVEGRIGRNIDGSSTLANSISISICIVAILIQCAVAISAFYKMRTSSSTKSVDWRLRLLFLGAFFCAFMPTSVDLMANVLDEVGYGYPYECIILFLASTGFFFFVLLCTLIFRLHITFEDTAYRMSAATKTIFGFILLVIFIESAMVPFIGIFSNRETFMYRFVFIGIIFVPLYVLGSVMAVALFLHNLSKLTKKRGNGGTSTDVPESPVDITLDRPQMKLSDLAARYIGLFAIANLSFFVCYALAISICFHSGLRDIPVIMDYTINFLCVYLQSSQEHYHRLCGCCDKRFRNITRRRARSLIYKHAVESSKSKSPTPTDTVSTSSPTAHSVQSAVSSSGHSGRNVMSECCVEMNIAGESTAVSQQ